MAMLLRISFLFIAIITFRQADGRYVGGNQRVKIRVMKSHGQISDISKDLEAFDISTL